jgi:predicted S18 family serine protease
MKYLTSFFLILFLGLFYSNSVNLDLPAVSSDNLGSLVNINITSIKGTGKIYFQIPPYTGISYQESFINALNFIEFENPGFSKNNDFFIDFYGEKTSSIEGASGGVATAVLLKSLAENKKINDSIVVTGEINSLGDVLPVGGLPEKLVASYFSNKTMLLIPSSISTNEKVISKKLSLEFIFPVYEYDSFDSAYVAYVSNDLSELEEISLPPENFSNVYVLDEVETNVFFNSIVYEMFVQYENDLVYVMRKYPDFMPYFDSIYGASYHLYDQGHYSYSAGNELFLALETLSLLTSSYSDEEFDVKLNEINNCLNRTKINLDKYEGPLEYYIASEVRYVKAKDTIEMYINESDNPSIRIYAPSLLLRSKLWCDSAERMSMNKEYSDFNKEKLIGFIKSKLLSYSGNSSSHLNATRNYYSEEFYGASLNEIIDYESGFIDCEGYEFDYAWSQMMYNHALYLNTSTRYGDNSYNEISKIACSYDRIINEYNSIIFEEPEDVSEIDNFYVLCGILILILFTLSIIYYVLKRW